MDHGSTTNIAFISIVADLIAYYIILHALMHVTKSTFVLSSQKLDSSLIARNWNSIPIRKPPVSS